MLDIDLIVFGYGASVDMYQFVVTGRKDIDDLRSIDTALACNIATVVLCGEYVKRSNFSVNNCTSLLAKSPLRSTLNTRCRSLTGCMETLRLPFVSNKSMSVA